MSYLIRSIFYFPRITKYFFLYPQIDFAVEIYYTHEVEYKVSAYGKEIKIIDVKAYRQYTNQLFYPHGLPVPAIDYSYPYMNFEFKEPPTPPDQEFYVDPNKLGVHHLVTTTTTTTTTEGPKVDEATESGNSSESEFSDRFDDTDQEEFENNNNNLRVATGQTIGKSSLLLRLKNIIKAVMGIV